MKLTKQSEIAIRILVLCAHSTTDNPITTRCMARLAGTTKDYAAQIVAKLARSGHVVGIRGRDGGIALAKPAASINVGEVLRLTEPDFGTMRRDESRKHSVAGFDALRHAATAAYVSIFDKFTIADLVADLHSEPWLMQRDDDRRRDLIPVAEVFV